MFTKRPFVYRLGFHEAGNPPITWEEGMTDEQLRARLAAAKSPLMAWFEYNAQHHHGDHRNLLFRQFPTFFVWLSPRWVPRQRGNVIARVYVAYPSQGEVFYIRLLLTERRGVISFEDLRTVDDVLCDTFREAARRLGMVEDNSAWQTMFDETAPFRTAHVLRLLFVNVLMEGAGDPIALWHYIADALSDDLITRIEGRDIPQDLQNPHHDFALYLMEKNLRAGNRSLSDFGLPIPVVQWEPERHPNHLIAAELDYDQPAQADQAAQMIARLNEGQREARMAILNAVNSEHPHSSFSRVQGDVGRFTFTKH